MGKAISINPAHNLSCRLTRPPDDRSASPHSSRPSRSSGWPAFSHRRTNTASEAEDFQAVGIKCREALIALGRDHAGDDWIGDLESATEIVRLQGMGEHLRREAGRRTTPVICEGTSRQDVDLTVWLQHYTDAAPDDADIVLDATNHLLGTLGGLMYRRDRGPLERCPRCASYRLDEDGQVVEEPEQGYLAFTVSGACGWRSESAFTSWAEHFKDADIEGYLNEPTTGISDRLHRKERRQARDRDDS